MSRYETEEITNPKTGETRSFFIWWSHHERGLVSSSSKKPPGEGWKGHLAGHLSLLSQRRRYYRKRRAQRKAERIHRERIKIEIEANTSNINHGLSDILSEWIG